MNIAFLKTSTLFSVLALVTMASSAHADPVVLNGGFEQTTLPASSIFGTGLTQQVTSWGTSGYNFVFLPGTADTTGAIAPSGSVKLWGPADGSANGLTASPDGGNYLALDGAYLNLPLTQTINGLNPGTGLIVSFYYGGAQQYGFDGPTTSQLQVSLGSESYLTPVLDVASHGFSGWQSVSFTFAPTSSSEVLSFMAIGTPSGVPPFALLDGVTVAQTPEPGSLALFSTGLLGLGGYLRSRFRKNGADQA
jgi:hypothetical protein